MKPRTIAIVGAESTGKSTLALGLAAALRARGRDVAVVPEYLREFCDLLGRTPRQAEQAAIAAEQTRRIAVARSGHELVVADTSALMIAVYSEHVFGDTSLYAQALADHRRCDLTLLTALDLPWQAGRPAARRPPSPRTGRRACACRVGRVWPARAWASPWSSASGGSRLTAALRAVDRALETPAVDADGSLRWQWFCERCGDAGCERHLLPRWAQLIDDEPGACC